MLSMHSFLIENEGQSLIFFSETDQAFLRGKMYSDVFSKKSAISECFAHV